MSPREENLWEAANSEHLCPVLIIKAEELKSHRKLLWSSAQKYSDNKTEKCVCAFFFPSDYSKAIIPVVLRFGSAPDGGKMKNPP